MQIRRLRGLIIDEGATSDELEFMKIDGTKSGTSLIDFTNRPIGATYTVGILPGGFF